MFFEAVCLCAEQTAEDEDDDESFFEDEQDDSDCPAAWRSGYNLSCMHVRFGMASHRFSLVVFSCLLMALCAIHAFLVVFVCPVREIGTGEGRAALCHALLRRNAAEGGPHAESKSSNKQSGQINGHVLVETNNRMSGMSCMLTARFRGTLCLTASASLLSSSWSGHVEVIY